MQTPKVKILLKNNKDIFALFCLFNSYGYDTENRKEGMNKTRVSVRKNLKKITDKNLNKKIRAFLKDKHQYFLIEMLFNKNKELIQILKSFDKLEKVDFLWKKCKPNHEKELKRYKNIKKDINIILNLLDLQRYPVKKIVLIPNLLDAYWRGYGPTIKNTQYIIFGPSPYQNNHLITHEFLHSVFNKNTKDQKIINLFKEGSKILKNNYNRSDFSKIGYSERQVILSEYLIRAFHIFFKQKFKKENINEALRNDFKKGFVLIKKFLSLIEKNIKK